MTKDEAFLKAISADPNDNALRLVYADWLDEQNDPRAEFVRLKARLSELSPDTPEYQALESREKELRSRFPDRWVVLFDLPAWCIMGNIVAEHHSGPGGAEIRHGTRLFRPSARIYLAEVVHIDILRQPQVTEHDRLQVIGQHRKSRQWIKCYIRVRYTTNWRVTLERQPGVLIRLRKEWWPGFELREKEFLCPEERGAGAVQVLLNAFDNVWRRRALRGRYDRP
jgi:uncharacterized protein (TIGR02996 family)